MQLKDYLWGLASVAPLFLVYLLAAILGLVNWRKHKPAAKFLALGGAMGVLVILSSFLVQHLLWTNFNLFSDDFETTVMVSRLIGVGADIVLAVSLAIIVFAVFVGRKPMRQDDDEPQITSIASP